MKQKITQDVISDKIDKNIDYKIRDCHIWVSIGEKKNLRRDVTGIGNKWNINCLKKFGVFGSDGIYVNKKEIIKCSLKLL